MGLREALKVGEQKTGSSINVSEATFSYLVPLVIRSMPWPEQD